MSLVLNQNNNRTLDFQMLKSSKTEKEMFYNPNNADPDETLLSPPPELGLHC